MPAPWIACDEHGENEHKVEVGHGTVSAIEAKDKRSSVKFKDENPKLTKPVTGAVWNDSPEHAVCVESHAEGKRVAYRIETHRADKIDPAIPFADLGQFDKFRRVVHVEFAPPDTPDPAWFSKNSQAPARPSGPVVSPEAPAGLDGTSAPDGHDGHAAAPKTAPWRVRIVTPDEVEALLNKMAAAGYEPAHVLYAAVEKVLVAARRVS